MGRAYDHGRQPSRISFHPIFAADLRRCYIFRVDVNAGRYFEESSFENNVLEIPVLIPAQ